MDTPFNEDDVLFSNWLASLKNVNFSIKNREKLFWVEKPEELKTPKRKTSSPLNGRIQTPSKRSRSAPGNGNEEGEEEDKKPLARQPRVVRFQNADQHQQKNGAKLLKHSNNRDPRVNRAVKSRTRSEHRNENVLKIVGYKYFQIIKRRYIFDILGNASHLWISFDW